MKQERIEKYRKTLNASDLSEQQEIELLTALNNIMRTFAEVGHGVHSINRNFPEIFNKTDHNHRNLSD